MHALDYLAESKPRDVPGVCVTYGDEPFLKRLVLKRLRSQVLEGDDGDFSLTTFSGLTVAWRDMADELATVALFGGGRRLVVIDEADDFVSRQRAQLEAYVAEPKPSGVLVLEVGSWPSNTRLYKAVEAHGLPIECTAPTGAKLVSWLTSRAKQEHNARLDRQAAEELAELVGPELGLLDQELAKLAASIGPGGEISAALVETLVHGGRAQTIWQLLDAALAGDAVTALEQLDRLLLGGENAVGLLAQIGSTLRRFAAATRVVEQAEAEGRRVPIRTALEAAGFKSFILGKAEGQLKQLGRVRAGRLYKWLLEADLALKGTSSSAARSRIVLEQLIARLSRSADARMAAG